MENCERCGQPIAEGKACECNPRLCSGCCECDDQCECGCQGK